MLRHILELDPNPTHHTESIVVGVAIGVVHLVRMDSHSFGEPVPVVSATEDGRDEPRWTVDVIRTSGNVVVGTLLISNTTLPPRKNKKNKIVWRLPESIHGELPRFGEQDKKRLWELFKELKKKRRKSQNKSNGKEDEDDSDSKAEHFIELQGSVESIASSPSSNFLSPPPGFECSNPTPTTDDPTTLLEHVSISSGPPGLSTAVALAPITDRRQQYISVPACGSIDALALLVGAAVFERFRHLVEGTVLTTMSTANDEDSVLSLLNTWLECYTEGATQSLLVGSAHTTAVTPMSRREQWCSVLFSAPSHQKYWTCRGWTAVPVAPSCAALNSMVLLVLNGTTKQMETELLSYTLTVLLHGSAALDEMTHHFVIVNAILTLQPTTTVP
jgi:hypothetical protein